METYEVVEMCPHCETENVFQWNVEIMGYVAECQCCGKKLMLCDECMHSDDNPNMYCDWCKDYGGLCCRDNSPIVLMTRGKYNNEEDDYHELYFSVPINWLKEYISSKWNSLEEFLNKYTWDISLNVYEEALLYKKIITSEEIYRGNDL